MEGGLVVVGIFVVLFALLALNAIKVVQEYDRLVVFRIGHCIGQKGPGIVWLWPIIDRAVAADLREQVLEVPQQTCITKDNAPIDIDFLVYSRVFDPVQSVVRVADFARASQGVAMTTLRAVIGDITLDDVLSRRDEINQILQTKLDEVTGRWGVKVTSVEIREIEPPREVQEAMNRQMSAERNRRATVTEAEGARQAAIAVAEGEKQAAILRAEGERQAAILRAEGFSLALGTIHQVAKEIDARTLQLQYFETLKALGASPATKLIFPLEFTSLLAGFGARGAARADGGA
ncbi:MAG: SPFH/Band 7/PHB domain protein [Chloroflexi bacterium]|nr:SPFH/Band 7/PHB domain protein [Chloroflexota bacterium]